MKLFFRCFCFLAVFFQLSHGFTFAADLNPVTEEVSDRNYFPKVRYLIQMAKSSIDISVDALAVSDEVSDQIAEVLNELMKASKKDVRVRIFVNTFPTEGAYSQDLFLREDKLEELKSVGVHVYFVSPKYRVADRLMIVDRKLVLEGGLPWTREAFIAGLGSATMIDSEDLANRKILRLEMLPIWNVQQEKEEKTGGVLPVPIYLLQDIKYFPNMVSGDDADVLRIYIALLRIYFERHQNQFNIVLNELSAYLPSMSTMDQSVGIHQAMKALSRLKEDYGLITISSEEHDEMEVSLNLPNELGPVVSLPLSFIQEGYAKELSARAIYAYLVITYRMQMSGSAPVWLGSERNIEQDFPIQKENFRLAISELRRSNLIEVFPFMLNPKEPYQSLEQMEYRYLLNSIPTTSEKLSVWNRMREEFGDDDFIRAKEAAEAFGEPEDPKVIMTYLDLIKSYAYEDIVSVTQHVSELPPQSTPSLLDYLSTLLKNETHRDTGVSV